MAIELELAIRFTYHRSLSTCQFVALLLPETQ